MPFGYIGRVLRVDLSSERVWIERPEENFYRRYFGGVGFIGYYLLKELPVGVDPLGPENKLVFAVGVVTGAPFAGNSRISIGAKSPLTGAFASSEAGGFFPAELKMAGFDAVVVEGRAEEPVYLWVHDGEAEIRDAKKLWGLHIKDTQKAIREEVGDDLVRTSLIGPGGEKLVRYACVINDLKHTAGRTGMGAVMGSKNLKGIAARGHQRIKIADRDKISELNKWFLENREKLWKTISELGTGAMMEVHVSTGNLPTRNFRDGNFENPSAISAQRIRDTVRLRMEGCYACPVRCKKVVKIDEPWSVDPDYGGPEYETLAAFGSDCGVDDLAAICKANEICQRYTIDTIATGATIAFAMECFENGLLTKEDTGGIELTFGNAEAMVKVVEMIAERRGIGDLLAEGTKRAAEKIGKGAEKFAVHVKGQEVPMHEPRLKRALGVGYATSHTGADHVHNVHDTGFTTEEAIKKIKSLGILEPITVEGITAKKMRFLKYMVDRVVANDCMIICLYPPWSIKQKSEIVQAVTGWETSVWELMKVGERAFNLARIFNLREGFTAKDDWLPDRFFHPATSGPLVDTPVDPDALREGIRMYYGIRGWDEDTGVPTKGKLRELDIEWAIEHLPR